MAKRIQQSASPVAANIVAAASQIASTIYARLESSAALASAMRTSTERSASFKDTVFAVILDIRAEFVGQIPVENKSIATQMHVNYLTTIDDLFGRGNAKQAGKNGPDGAPLYLEGELAKQIREHYKGDATKLKSATEDFSRVRNVAKAAWLYPTEATTGKLQDAAKNSVSLLKTGKVAPKAGKMPQTVDVKNATSREALEMLIAVEGAAKVLEWAAELLASDAAYKKAHSTQLTAITALARQL